MESKQHWLALMDSLLKKIMRGYDRDRVHASDCVRVHGNVHDCGHVRVNDRGHDVHENIF